jgi:hypothetical protein
MYVNIDYSIINLNMHKGASNFIFIQVLKDAILKVKNHQLYESPATLIYRNIVNLLIHLIIKLDINL